MEKVLSIREVQDLLRGKSSVEVGEILSGEETGNWCGIWYDWFCSTSSLPSRAAKFRAFIMGLSGSFVDTHYIWLKNNCPGAGSLYDDIRISPITDGESYNVGFSWGNGDTRQREVFDTRNNEVVYYDVKDSKEATELVNKLLG